MIAASKQGNLWLIKTDSQGDTMWSRTLASEGYHAPYQLFNSGDEAYVLIGEQAGDLWFAKMNHAGDFVWEKTYGGEKKDIGYSAVQTPDQGYLLTGMTASFGEGGEVLWLLKADPQGDTTWTRTYSQMGDDFGKHVIIDSQGNYLLTGGTHGTAFAKTKGLPTPKKYDLWVLKADSSGDTLWTKSFGKDLIMERGHSIQETSQGYMVCADITSGWSNLWLLLLNQDGDSLVTNTIGATYITELGLCMQPSSNGNYIITGKKQQAENADLWLICVDEQGEELWEKSYGENYDECGYWVEERSEGGYIVAGYTESSADNPDVYLLKTDAEGDTMTTGSEEPSSCLKDNWHLSPVGSRIVLSYQDMPGGFCAEVYAASGRKVDEIHFNKSSGSLTWGDSGKAGVYFIRVITGSSQTTRKAVLIK